MAEAVRAGTYPTALQQFQSGAAILFPGIRAAGQIALPGNYLRQRVFGTFDSLRRLKTALGLLDAPEPWKTCFSGALHGRSRKNNEAEAEQSLVLKRLCRFASEPLLLTECAMDWDRRQLEAVQRQSEREVG